MSSTPLPVEPSHADITQLKGLVLLEFGAAWCSYCQAAQPLITQALLQTQHIRHIKIEDGKGKRLGRQFAVKLWPTLILLNDGIEVKRVVRPTTLNQMMQLLGQ